MTYAPIQTGISTRPYWQPAATKKAAAGKPTTLQDWGAEPNIDSWAARTNEALASARSYRPWHPDEGIIACVRE